MSITRFFLVLDYQLLNRRHFPAHFNHSPDESNLTNCTKWPNCWHLFHENTVDRATDREREKDIKKKKHFKGFFYRRGSSRSIAPATFFTPNPVFYFLATPHWLKVTSVGAIQSAHGSLSFSTPFLSRSTRTLFIFGEFGGNPPDCSSVI